MNTDDKYDCPYHKVIGYIQGKIEALHDNIVEVKRALLNHIGEENGNDKQMLERLQSIELNMTKASVAGKVLKAIGLTLIAILAFKFGDVSTIWNSLFK